MKIVTFAGHRRISRYIIDAKVEKAIYTILDTDSEFVFYTGGMGDFDMLCESTVRTAKSKHTELKIELILVLPYFSNKYNTNKEYYNKQYDNIVFPQEIHQAHYKSAITKRNEWMVDRADIVLAHITRDYGGACKIKKYAVKQGKEVIDI